MASRRLKSPLRYTAVIMFCLIMLSLHLMSSATQDSSRLGDIYGWLLLVNTTGLVLMAVLVSANVYSLIRQFRKRKAGSQLTARMFFLFVLLTLAPASIVFYYSVQFLHQGIDSWFDIHIDQAMEDALELSRSALDQHMRTHLDTTLDMARKLEHTSDRMAASQLNELREQAAAVELTLLSPPGRIIASSSINTGLLLPSMPENSILARMRQNNSYVGLDPATLGQEMQIRTLAFVGSDHRRYLQALYQIPVRTSQLAESVAAALIHHREMTYLRKSLKLSFSLTLSLVLLLSLLTAIWVAFVSIRHIVAPVRELVLGTRAVAEGNYERRLPVRNQDELGFLVESFNDMTQRVANARNMARQAQQEAERQSAYLETVLGSLSSGVLSFDADMHLRTTNQAASNILGLDISQHAGQPLNKLLHGYLNLGRLIQAISTPLQQASGVWQTEISLPGPSGKQTLLCRGAPLFDRQKTRAGAVIVFDDLTELIQAQKNAAWSEVARRLAHEIKNPLTPIQLSAERLQHKLAHKLDGEEAGILGRATSTIVQQVEAMKTMVNTFTEYARPPKLQFSRLALNTLIEEVLALYTHTDDQQEQTQSVQFERSLHPGLPDVEADSVRMRQVLHNLIKNAQEAMLDQQRSEITLATRWVREQGHDYVTLSITDTGSGIPAEIAEKLFDPYVTNKPKGSGLGLAIVKKIIEEHGGTICLDSAYNQGTCFIIRLPAVTDSKPAYDFHSDSLNRSNIT